jgi:hypothetical protein
MSRPCASYSFFFEILPSVITCRTKARRAHLDFQGPSLARSAFETALANVRELAEIEENMNALGGKKPG